MYSFPVISSIGGIVVDGRVYPSATPPSEPSAPTTPLSESVEQKQSNTNSCAVSIAMEGAPPSQAISLLSNQPSANMPPSAYITHNP